MRTTVNVFRHSTTIRRVTIGAAAVAAAVACCISPRYAIAQTPSATDGALQNGGPLKLLAQNESVPTAKAAPATVPTSPPPAERRPLLPPSSSLPSSTSPAPTPTTKPSPTPSSSPAGSGPAIQVPAAKPPLPTGDPTVPGPAIRELLGQGAPREAGAPAAVPEVRLTSRIAVRNRPVVAVLEVGGRSVTVKEGDEFTVPVGGELVPLRAAVLTVSDVQIEIVNRRAMMHLK